MIDVKRKNREIRDAGTVTFEVTGDDVGKTIDFMGIAGGFRVVAVNLSVDEAFANADNKISVGIEGDSTRFMGQQQADGVAGFAGNNRQLTASQSMGILVDVVGAASATGKATVSVGYVKLAVSRQEY